MKFWRRRNRKAFILAFATMAVAAPVAQAGHIVADGGAGTPTATSSYYASKAQAARAGLNQLSTSQTYSAQELRALTLRSQGLNAMYQQSSTRPDDKAGARGVGVQPTAPPDLIERRVAVLQREQATTAPPDLIERRVAVLQMEQASSINSPDNRAGVRGPGVTQTHTPQLVTVKSDRFDWKDAGIGAGTAIGATLILVSGLIASRRRHEGELAV
jgi:hypothetical protein